VILASVYMIRFFQRTMHGRLREGVESRDILPVGPDLVTIAPLIAVIIALGVSPQIVLSKLDHPQALPPGKVAEVLRATSSGPRGWTAYAPLPGQTP
jgi:NADH:ubiquinone oxidoreductase subunit 4 (subunit M)